MALIFEKMADTPVFDYPIFSNRKSAKTEHLENFNKEQEQEYIYYSYDEPKALPQKNPPAKKMKEDKDKFSTFEFIQDNTILTNVEDYANRVRKDVDKYVIESKIQSESLKKETEELNLEAKQKFEQTQAEAESLISEAKNQVDEIKKTSEKTGHQKGFEQGKQEALEEGRKHFDRLEKMITEIQLLRVNLFKQHENELTEICLILARMIVHEELKTNKNLVLNGLRHLIKRFEGMGKIKIKVHPVDYDFLVFHKNQLNGVLDEDQKIVFRRDTQATPGAPIIESNLSEINLDIKKQFSVLDAKFKNCADQRAMLYKQHMKEIQENEIDRG